MILEDTVVFTAKASEYQELESLIAKFSAQLNEIEKTVDEIKRTSFVVTTSVP